MCLYPTQLKNRKYTATKKNGGIIPAIPDNRVKYIEAPCGRCFLCKKRKARDWQIRLYEDIKTHRNGKFITLTFSNESIVELMEAKISWTDRKSKEIIKRQIHELNGYDKDNAIAKVAIRRWLERYRKEYNKSVRHWLVTELGHEGTENIHLHGIVWTDDLEKLLAHWKYGYVWKGDIKYGKKVNYVSNRTVNYIVKYIHKMDSDHKWYNPKVLASAGIGQSYVNSHNGKNHTIENELYRNEQGYKIKLPSYLRNKIYSEKEREKMWIDKMNKGVKWIGGFKINEKSKNYETEYWGIMNALRERNTNLGYRGNEVFIEEEEEEIRKRNELIERRVRNKNINNKDVEKELKARKA